MNADPIHEFKRFAHHVTIVLLELPCASMNLLLYKLAQ
jgi:hypothetical protein